MGSEPLLTDPPADGATVRGEVRLRELGGDDGSGHTPVDVLTGAGTVLQLVGTGDPFDLTGLQVRAGSVGVEGHRSVVVNCVNCSTSEGGQRPSVYSPMMVPLTRSRT